VRCRPACPDVGTLQRRRLVQSVLHHLLQRCCDKPEPPCLLELLPTLPSAGETESVSAIGFSRWCSRHSWLRVRAACAPRESGYAARSSSAVQGVCIADTSTSVVHSPGFAIAHTIVRGGGCVELLHVPQLRTQSSGLIAAERQVELGQHFLAVGGDKVAAPVRPLRQMPRWRANL
jgi:hypothetical protein